jgi:hypothetical protein
VHCVQQEQQFQCQHDGCTWAIPRWYDTHEYLIRDQHDWQHPRPLAAAVRSPATREDM